MTARHAGSKTFVPAVLLRREVDEMIGPMQATRANGRANEMLRRYARWEYGAADADWILAGLRTTRTRSAPRSLRRLVAGRGVPAVRIVGHPHARL